MNKLIQITVCSILCASAVLAQGIACPGADEAIQSFGERLVPRVPDELLACIPRTATGTDSICVSPPLIDAAVCATETGSDGCSVRIRLDSILEEQPGSWQILFTAEAHGEAVEQGESCAVDTTVTEGELRGTVEAVVIPPTIRFQVLDVAASLLMPEQVACSSSMNATIADAVRNAVESRLAQEFRLRVESSAAVCGPDADLSAFDRDGDGVLDCDDACADDPLKSDPGACGCGVVDDADGDGFAFCDADCDDGDARVWSTPGEVGGVSIDPPDADGVHRMTWSPPADPGATAWSYRVLASDDVSDFGFADCIDTSATTEETFLAEIPSAGRLRAILVGALNACPSDGMGPLGTSSSGEPRVAPPCP